MEAEITLADLQAEYRLLNGLGDRAEVSTRQLPELLDLIGQIRQGLPGNSLVTRNQLAARVREAAEAERVREAAEAERVREAAEAERVREAAEAEVASASAGHVGLLAGHWARFTEQWPGVQAALQARLQPRSTVRRARRR